MKMKVVLALGFFLQEIFGLQIRHLSGPEICSNPVQIQDQIRANTTIQNNDNGKVIASTVLEVPLNAAGVPIALTNTVIGRCQGAQIQAVVSADSEEYSRRMEHFFRSANNSDLLMTVHILEVTKLDDVPIPPIGMFREMDLNSDSEITLEEWLEFGKIKLEAVKNHQDPDIAKHFPEMAENLEGKIIELFERRNFDPDRKITKNEWEKFKELHHEEL